MIGAKPRTVDVVFPDGRVRPVEASFHQIELETLRSRNFQHLPILEPDPIDGFTFMELARGGWVAVPVPENSR